MEPVTLKFDENLSTQTAKEQFAEIIKFLKKHPPSKRELENMFDCPMDRPLTDETGQS